MTSISDLPNRVLAHIASFLDFRSQVAMSGADPCLRHALISEAEEDARIQLQRLKIFILSKADDSRDFYEKEVEVFCTQYHLSDFHKEAMLQLYLIKEEKADLENRLEGVFGNIPNVFQTLEFQHSPRPKFEPGEADIEGDPVKDRFDGDGFKVRDAGVAENQFLKDVRYNNGLSSLINLKAKEDQVVDCLKVSQIVYHVIRKTPNLISEMPYEQGCWFSGNRVLNKVVQRYNAFNHLRKELVTTSPVDQDELDRIQKALYEEILSLIVDGYAEVGINSLPLFPDIRLVDILHLTVIVLKIEGLWSSENRERIFKATYVSLENTQRNSDKSRILAALCKLGVPEGERDYVMAAISNLEDPGLKTDLLERFGASLLAPQEETQEAQPFESVGGVFLKGHISTQIYEVSTLNEEQEDEVEPLDSSLISYYDMLEGSVLGEESTSECLKGPINAETNNQDVIRSLIEQIARFGSMTEDINLRAEYLSNIAKLDALNLGSYEQEELLEIATRMQKDENKISILRVLCKPGLALTEFKKIFGIALTMQQSEKKAIFEILFSL